MFKCLCVPYLLLPVWCIIASCTQDQTKAVETGTADGPIVITTWTNVESNLSAMGVLEAGMPAIDAIEAGIRTKELDENDESVGIGGLPDEEGRVTLDASIMDNTGNAGSVTYLQHILHPISVARSIMDTLDHVMLSGDGAYRYAVSQGFEERDLLSENARAKWEAWKKNRVSPDNHDTIGMLARDETGNLSGGCSTSGMAFKKAGRVGDSPIIGAGLFVDNNIGAATATGKGEEVMKTVGSFLVVELMRNGHSPQRACEMAVRRIIDQHPQPDFQVGFIALSKNGSYGAYSIKPGFEYTMSNKGKTLVYKADSYEK